MRIAYVALGMEPRNMAGGVGRKIKAQVRLWTESGHAARLFAMMPGCPDADVYTYQPASSLPVMREATRAAAHSRTLSRLIEDVRAFRADLIYLRAGSYLYPLHRLFSVGPTVIELNSNDIAERALRGPYAYWSHVLTRDLFLRNASGLIAVTHEIANLPVNQRYRKPICVIGNGIDLQEYEPLPAPRHTRPSIALVGSPGMRWHGVDKLIHLAELCPDLQINIVGYGSQDFDRPLPPNVKAFGFLDSAGVRGVLKDTDVACGSLALHRNRMQEGSTLKVPEAMAYGIPILLAYHDAGLEGFESDCILQLPNSEDNIAANAEQIRSFSYGMMGRRLGRDQVAPFIDQHAKEETRLAFFAQIIRKSRNGAH